MRQVLILEDFPPPHVARILSPNGRAYWAKRYNAGAVVAWFVKRAVTEQGLHRFVHPTCRLVYVYPNHRRRDLDNATGGVTKAVLDTLVRLGVLRDDSPEWLTLLPVCLEVTPGVRRLVIELEEE